MDSTLDTVLLAILVCVCASLSDLSGEDRAWFRWLGSLMIFLALLRHLVLRESCREGSVHPTVHSAARTVSPTEAPCGPRLGVAVPGCDAARQYALDGATVEHCEGPWGLAACLQHPEVEELLSCLLHHIARVVRPF